jgi:hypothetical protein
MKSDTSLQYIYVRGNWTAIQGLYAFPIYSGLAINGLDINVKGDIITGEISPPTDSSLTNSTICGFLVSYISLNSNL